ncbi:hypothetical protein [Actinomadura madurae]|uniref:hypothetical protein n=1 Tax=Actinomadura madurae TaxID=1993 RepID=UPI0020D206BA|nr:hypothetical protein [Actinomadura madurae]MCP9978349.1 hypothetical protein [Actinomadura madurae]
MRIAPGISEGNSIATIGVATSPTPRPTLLCTIAPGQRGQPADQEEVEMRHAARRYIPTYPV